MKKVAVTALALAMSSVVFGQDEEEKSAWSGETELGFTYESGNTNEENLLFKQKVVFESGNWLNTFLATAENSVTRVKVGRDDGTGNIETVEEDQRTAEKYFVSDKLDYFFTDHTYGFARLTWEKDRFSGFENQASEVIGVGHSFFPDSETLTLKLELGGGARQDEWDEDLEIEDPNNPGDMIPDPEAGKTVDEAIAYFSDQVAWKFAEGAELGQNLAVEYGDENTISRFDVYVKAQLVSSLSMKVSYDYKYTEEVPEDKENADKKFNVSLLYSF